jgi:MFS transporter, DHA1 family, inner membrane transport protein
VVSPRTVGITLLLCLAASQCALLVLTPVLPIVASDLDVSTATAGQLRTISGLAAGASALLTGLLAARTGLRELLALGIASLAVGSATSALAPSFVLLGVAQLLIGVGIGVSYSAAIAAVAEWSAPEDRPRVLALALLGPPAAWILGMPLTGIAGDVSWRLGVAVVPLALAAAAGSALVRAPSTPPAARRAALGAVLRHPGVARWSSGELLAFSAWAGSLVFVGALFVESYGLSTRATGIFLGLGALVYVPGNVLFRRWIREHERTLLVGLPLSAAATVAVLGAVRPSEWFSLGVFALLSFIAGGRTLVGSSAGLDLAPDLRLGITGVRTAALQLGYFLGAALGGAALAVGGYSTLGFTFAALFVGATIPHVLSPLGVAEAAPP